MDESNESRNSSWWRQLGEFAGPLRLSLSGSMQAMRSEDLPAPTEEVMQMLDGYMQHMTQLYWSARDRSEIAFAVASDGGLIRGGIAVNSDTPNMMPVSKATIAKILTPEFSQLLEILIGAPNSMTWVMYETEDGPGVGVIDFGGAR